MTKRTAAREGWFRALHLVERGAAGAPARPGAGERERAARRLVQWRSQAPFQDETWFRRRCAADGLDADAFAALLAEPLERLVRRTPGPPPWAERLERAFAAPAAAAPPGERTAFTSIVAPLLRQAWGELEAHARRVKEHRPEAPFDAAAVPALLYRGVPTRIDWMLSRAVVVEMRAAKLLGDLRGETPRERFRSFVRGLAEPPRALAFLAEYPVLARLLVETLERWVETSAELLDRLAADWAEIRERLAAGADPGPVEEISSTLGDLHRGGRAVRSLRFASGLRVVYKPRPLEVDVRFAELLAWLRRRGAPEIRTPAVLDRGTHGWCEFVAAGPCPSPEAAERFFERQGALLALLHALNANDFHRSNLVAHGEHPVLLDLESLLGADYGQGEAESFDVLAEYELANSVWRVMLLPYLREGKGGEVVDMSGLGGEGGQPALGDEPVWEDRETDEMRLVWKRPTLDPTGNQPTLGERRLDALAFSERIVAGFTSMYRLLARHREELLAEGSPLRRLAACELRSIFRASRAYSLLLREGLHPDRLRDALDRDRLFDHLWHGIEGARFPEVVERLFPSERAALWRGDLAYFTARGDSRDVRDDRGVVLPGLFRRSGLEVASDRLRGLGEEDLRFQTWVVRSSLTALAGGDQVGYRPYPPPRRPREVGAGELVAAAARVGDRLSEIARSRNGHASWLGLHTVAGDRCELRPLDVDLYSGLPGIALFLAYLGAVTGEERHAALAGKAWTTVELLLARRRPRMLGAFDGWGGVLYAAGHLASLWRRPDLLERACARLDDLAGMVEGDEQLDLVRGASGCVLSLLSLDGAAAAALPLARRLGDRLVATAREAEPAGLCWDVAASRGRPLLGVSHGASGPAWALLELYGATGEEAYRRTALEALRFETSRFSAEHRNWPDLRIGRHTAGRAGPIFTTTWCHGACGIGLARLRMRRHLPEPWRTQADHDVGNAFATTLRHGFGTNHSLCHGDLGSLDFLLQAAAARDDGDWREAVARTTRRVVAGIEEHGWICGVPTAVETPGLMNGLAGIGLGLLRLAHPERVPSVLALEGPRETP
jgi:type 2 lantibiotic biosynthesis protein LanM